MSSLKKTLANCRNGTKSRGPVTPEGRRRSSENSLSHGLTARAVVLSNEDAGAFDEMLQQYMETFRPVGRFETDLVEQMVASRWREHRACSLETALLDLEMDTQEAELKRHFDGIDETTRATRRLPRPRPSPRLPGKTKFAERTTLGPRNRSCRGM